MDSFPTRSRRRWLVALLAAVVILFFLGWSQASLNLSFIHPSSATETLLVWAVSTVVFLAFVIFALILTRVLLKLYVERRQGRLGARFKTKMVAAFLGLSLVPVCFLFAFAYGLLNRSLDKWFGIPFDVLRSDANEIARQLELAAKQRATHGASDLAEDEQVKRALERHDLASLRALIERQVRDLGLASAVSLDPQGRVLARAGASRPDAADLEVLRGQFLGPNASAAVPVSGVPAWAGQLERSEFFWAACPVVGLPAQARHGGQAGPPRRTLGTILSFTRLPLGIQRAAGEIEREAQNYDDLSRERKALKRAYLSILILLTLLILFAATWFALFLSKQVTVPIQALAEATHEVSRGNLGFQVTARADGELGTLIQSFNEMTRQLVESRQAIEQATRELQRANRELEEHGNTLEAVLESIPTGVIGFDREGRITRINSAIRRLFGREGLDSARALSDLFSAEDARSIARLFRRAARQGTVTRSMDLDLGGRRAPVALTISSIRARHGPLGSVMVVEDLTELARGQKAAAWQEVAQRIAHEIKNPLTPIQLSAQRIRRLAERDNPPVRSQDFQAAVSDTTSLIEREVATLKTLVDEFSNFARFPASKPVPTDLNVIVEDALNVFNGRLDDIQIHRELAHDLPRVNADSEQMRRVVVNLIDNAAEALERAVSREIWVRTRPDPDRDVVELVVADSGPGIPAEAKERLFLPYSSTKRRGTGLGLAIVSRIVSEHDGWIRVEANQPRGTMFVIELPVPPAGEAER